jgi:hypothetical protein
VKEGGKGLGAAMAGGNPEEGRQEGEFYPTPPDVTKALCLQYAELLKDRIVLEPCAGDGAMAFVIAPFCRKVIATDIAPRHDDVRKADVFNMDVPRSWCVITNPPFNIAEDVIRHLLDESPSFVALVLKATYWHARQRAGLFEQFRPYAVHPLTWRPDFLGKGAPTMDVMWCVWRNDVYGEPIRPYTVYAPMRRPE